MRISRRIPLGAGLWPLVAGFHPYRRGPINAPRRRSAPGATRQRRADPETFEDGFETATSGPMRNASCFPRACNTSRRTPARRTRAQHQSALPHPGPVLPAPAGRRPRWQRPLATVLAVRMVAGWAYLDDGRHRRTRGPEPHENIGAIQPRRPLRRQPAVCLDIELAGGRGAGRAGWDGITAFAAASVGPFEPMGASRWPYDRTQCKDRARAGRQHSGSSANYMRLEPLTTTRHHRSECL
jgi:hypothetical protein